MKQLTKTEWGFIAELLHPCELLRVASYEYEKDDEKEFLREYGITFEEAEYIVEKFTKYLGTKLPPRLSY